LRGDYTNRYTSEEDVCNDLRHVACGRRPSGVELPPMSGGRGEQELFVVAVTCKVAVVKTLVTRICQAFRERRHESQMDSSFGRMEPLSNTHSDLM